MMSSADDGPRVEAHDRVYNLRSGRHIEYASSLVSRVLRSPACDTTDIIAADVG